MKTFRKTIEIGLGIVAVILIVSILDIGLSYVDGRQERLKEYREALEEIDKTFKLDTIALPEEVIIETEEVIIEEIK